MMLPLNTHRRYLTFSLRTLFILLTLFAVWTATIVNRARQQREAVKAIEALGGIQIEYDWQLCYVPVHGPASPWPRPYSDSGPPGPKWLRRLIGDEFFQEVWLVNLLFVETEPESEVLLLKSLPHLARLHGLRTLVIPYPSSTEAQKRTKAALPACEVIVISDT